MRTRLAHFLRPLAPVMVWKVVLLCLAYIMVADIYLQSADLENVRGQSLFFAGCGSVISAFFIAWMTRGVSRSAFLMLPVSVMVGLAFVMPSTATLLILDRKPLFLFLMAFMLSTAFFLPFYVTQAIKLRRVILSVPILAALLTLIISLAVPWGNALHLLLMPEWFYGRGTTEFAAMRFGVGMALVIGALTLALFVTYQINATRLQAGLPLVNATKQKFQTGKIHWNVVNACMMVCVALPLIISLLVIFLQDYFEWEYSFYLSLNYGLVILWFSFSIVTLLIDYHIPKLSRWAVVMPFSAVAASAGAGIFIFTLDGDVSDIIVFAVIALTLLTVTTALILPLISGGELHPMRAVLTIIVLAVFTPISAGLSGIAVGIFFELVFFYRPDSETILAPSTLAGTGASLAVSIAFIALFIIRQIRVTRGILQPSGDVFDFFQGMLFGADEPVEDVREKPKGKPKIILTVTTRQLNTAVYFGVGVLVILVLFGALWAVTYRPPHAPPPIPTITHTATTMLTPNATLAVTATDWRSPEVIAATELARGNNSPMNSVVDCATTPVTSPERIAYTTRSGGQVDIFIAEAGNLSNACRLTNTVEHDFSLTWSHDGERIAFFRYSADGNNIVSLLVAEMRTGFVITLPTENRAGGPNFTWSPDDEEILYTQFSEDNSMGIYAIASDGGTPPRAVYDSPQFESQPAWSNDGTKIAFGSGMDDGHLQLYVMDENGENPRQITPDGLYARFPTWSPDDSRIVFLVSSQTIALLDLATGQTSEINIENSTRNFFPRYSSNDTITVVATRDLIPNVYEIDLTGRILRNLTPGISVGAYSLWRSPDQ